MLYDLVADVDIDPGPLIQRVQSAEITTLNLGASSSGTLTLKLVDGELTRSCLEATLKLCAKQSLKLEEYEETIKNYQKNDVDKLSRRLQAAESMIKNLGEHGRRVGGEVV